MHKNRYSRINFLIILFLISLPHLAFANASNRRCESVFNQLSIPYQNETLSFTDLDQNNQSKQSKNSLKSNSPSQFDSQFNSTVDQLSYARRTKIALAKAHNHLIVQSNAFVVMRGLEDYQNAFQDKFTYALNQLRPNDHWIDVGSGSAKAQLEFLSQSDNSKVQTTAIAVNKPVVYSVLKNTYAFKHPGILQKHRYFSGKTVEELDLVRERLVSADLVTDLFGAFSYSPQIDQVLFKQISMLKVGGQLFVYTPLIMQIKIYDQKGNQIPIRDWLSSIPGVKVSSLFLGIEDSQYALDEFSLMNGFMLEKTSNEFRVPRLQLINMTSEIVPERTYRLNRP